MNGYPSAVLTKPWGQGLALCPHPPVLVRLGTAGRWWQGVLLSQALRGDLT